MNVLAITQARIGSTRLPAKVLKEVAGKSLLQIHLERILRAKRIDKLKVATTTETDSYKIVDIANKTGIEAVEGSLNNVLDRFIQAAKEENPQLVVRLTSDCPLIDPKVIDDIIDFAINNKLDYASNTLDPSFPDGIDVEVFTYDALMTAHKDAQHESDLEHVTPYIWRNSTFKGGSLFTSDCYYSSTDFSGLRLTVDTQEDFQVMEKVITTLGVEKSWIDYANFLQNNPDIRAINSEYKRNEGYREPNIG